MGGCASTEVDTDPLMTQEDKQELLTALTVHKDLDRIKSVLDRYPGIDVNTICLDEMDVDYCDNTLGSTPLSEVVMHYMQLEDKACGLMKLLIYEYGCDINARGSQYSLTPLHWAVWLNHEEGVRLLLETGKADLSIAEDSTSKNPVTVFDRALLEGDKTIISLLLSCSNFLTDSENRDERGKLDSGSKASTMYRQDKRELLMALVVHKDLDRLKAVLDKYPGIDLNSVGLDENGCNPLHLACRNGWVDAVDCLLSCYQMDVNCCNNSTGSTPLSEVVASYSGLEDITSVLMKLLIYEYGCDVNARGDKYSLNPLHWAVLLGYKDGVRLLLETGKVDLTIAEYTDSMNTTTVLDKALQNGDEDIIALIRSVASEDDD